MSLTFIGILLIAIGLPILVYGRVEAVLALLLACGILGGSAAVKLPALGGSSIPPIHFALLLAGIRIFLPGSGHGIEARAALRANWPLLLYAAYGVAIAIIGPRLFRGEVDLPVLGKKTSNYLFAVRPLMPTAQNITTAVYLIGTLLCAVIVHVVCSLRGGHRTLLRTAVIVAWANVAIGVIGVLTKNTAIEEVFLLLRNGNYAQLDQEYRGFIRITGLFPEASSYAIYTFVWFCFMFECWYRDVLPRRTGPITLALFATLIASTSATAYVSLGMFAIVLLLRLFVPGAARSDKLLVMFLTMLCGAVGISLMIVLTPGAGAGFVDMVQHMTLGKSTSPSGLQRAFWARKGLDAFAASHGLGTGPGSFRSSSLVTAVLGSMGVIGMALFVAQVVRALRPLRASTFAAVIDERTAVGVAAGWAAVMVIVPASLILPTCDLGTDFAVFSGAALALRARSARARVAGRLLAPGPLVHTGFGQPKERLS